MFWDNGAELNPTYDGIPIRKPLFEDFKDIDKVILETCYQCIPVQLNRMGLTEEKIDARYVDIRIQSRINFLHNYAEIYRDYIHGKCAEAGCFRGEFARYINHFFRI